MLSEAALIDVTFLYSHLPFTFCALKKIVLSFEMMQARIMITVIATIIYFKILNTPFRK